MLRIFKMKKNPVLAGWMVTVRLIWLSVQVGAFGSEMGWLPAPLLPSDRVEPPLGVIPVPPPDPLGTIGVSRLWLVVGCGRWLPVGDVTPLCLPELPLLHIATMKTTMTSSAPSTNARRRQ